MAENDEDEPGIAHVCVYLQKRVPTTRASMWPCVVEEDMNIPESRFAPPQIPDPDADPSE